LKSFFPAQNKIKFLYFQPNQKKERKKEEEKRNEMK
jgi:hypothetical protein